MRRLILIAPFLLTGAAWCVELEPISSAELCGSCHRAIQTAWKGSAHATAMTSRLFQDALEVAEGDFGKQARRVCLDCHSPLAVQTGDLSLKRKVSWEGVTCDYCHSMRSVSMDEGNPKAVLEFSLVKSGPLRDASPVAHGAAHSDIHTSSQVCAPCHEYQSPLGVSILTTYSEWKKSRYSSESVGCQSCHMGRVEGDVVEVGGASSGGSEVNLHEMPGGHSLKQLTKAIRARLTTARTDDSLRVEVTLANVGAGHYVPTGSPMREIVLELSVDPNQGRDFQEKKSYRRTMVDEQGNPVAREHLLFFKAASTLSDTRLAPDETRKESFSFPIPKGVPAQVKAELSYYYSPTPRTGSKESLTFHRISRLVR